MASTKRLLKERAGLARNPIPYVTFQDDNDDDDDDAMTDGAKLTEWRFILELSPEHDDKDQDAEIGRAADSPYCQPPVSDSSGKKSGGLLAGVTRAAKTSKKSSGDDASSSNAEGGPAYFAFQLDFPPNYPFKPPAITVLGPTYHPNIKKDTGEMCDAVLTGEGWGPTLNVKKICARLRKFLCDPDPDHPLESSIAQLLVEKPAEYAAAAWKHSCEWATKSEAEKAMARGKGKSGK